MKRYLIFQHIDYEEGGGWKDFVKSFDDRDLAINEAKKIHTEYHETYVIDLETQDSIWWQHADKEPKDKPDYMSFK
jgi:hypothetical protein